MNIFVKELKSNSKVFCFWVMGLIVMVFAGLTEFSGMQGTNMQEMIDLMNEFPKIVLAFFGMPAGIDVTTFGGYYFVLNNYIVIVICLYAIHLAVKAVTRENTDKTYEFLYTKPVTRGRILTMKLLASYLYLMLYCILNYIFAILSAMSIGVESELFYIMEFYSVISYVLASVFFAIAVLISSSVSKIEQSAMFSNMAFFVAFGMAVVYDCVENTKW
ncbi:MAG: ABC transporter permease subunit, partial [Eubacteriales bacterium]